MTWPREEIAYRFVCRFFEDGYGLVANDFRNKFCGGKVIFKYLYMLKYYVYKTLRNAARFHVPRFILNNRYNMYDIFSGIILWNKKFRIQNSCLHKVFKPDWIFLDHFRRKFDRDRKILLYYLIEHSYRDYHIFEELKNVKMIFCRKFVFVYVQFVNLFPLLCSQILFWFHSSSFSRPSLFPYYSVVYLSFVMTLFLYQQQTSTSWWEYEKNAFWKKLLLGEPGSL